MPSAVDFTPGTARMALPPIFSFNSPNNSMRHTGAPSYLQGLHSETPSGCPKPWIASNPINTVFLPHKCISFHIKEALDGFSLAYLNRACPLGPLLSQMRVTRTQTLQYGGQLI